MKTLERQGFGVKEIDTLRLLARLRWTETFTYGHSMIIPLLDFLPFLKQSEAGDLYIKQNKDVTSGLICIGYSVCY